MENNVLTDELIIKQIVRGSVEKYRFIVKKYQNMIFSIGMRFFRNEDDALDFTQEVFLKAFENISSFRGKSPFRFWLSRIAYNHGINRIKGRKNEWEFLEGTVISEERTPDKKYETREIHEILENAVQDLPDKYKICLDLYFYMGLPYNRIYEITEIPVNTIKSNVFRAKQILRDKLKGTIAEDYHEM